MRAIVLREEDPSKKCEPNKNKFMEESKKEEIYHIGFLMGKQGPPSPVRNQAGVEKLTIKTKTDSNANDQAWSMELQYKYMGLASPQWKPQQP